MARTHRQQLLDPLLEYWRIEFSGKAQYSVCLPLCVGIAVGALAFFVPSFNIAGDRGLADATLSLLSLLVGFYIAALGLAVTAGDPYLDEIPARPPLLHSDGTKEPISWRRFLAALFAHLVAVSFVSYLMGVAILLAAPFSDLASAVLGADKMNKIVNGLLRAAAGAVYSFALSHLLVTTLFGLHLMSQRLPELREKYLMSQKLPPQHDAVSDTKLASRSVGRRRDDP